VKIVKEHDQKGLSQVMEEILGRVTSSRSSKEKDRPLTNKVIML